MTIIKNENVITKEITINAPVNLVWLAWTISERVSEWFAPEAVVEAYECGTYELYFIPGNREEMNTKGCKITRIEKEEVLCFTWKGPDQFSTIMNNENKLTNVNVSFQSMNEETTKVNIEHVGFKTDDIWTEAIRWHEMAWSGVLSSLKVALEKGEGNLCCQP